MRRSPQSMMWLLALALLVGACSQQTGTQTPAVSGGTAGMNMGAAAPTVAPNKSTGATQQASVGTTASGDMAGMNMGGDAAPTATKAQAQGTGAGMAGMGRATMTDRPVPSEGVKKASTAEGAQPLAFRLEGGVKVFDLTAEPVLWQINDDTQVTAWAYNGMVPGPLFRLTEGDKVRVVFKNNLPEATSIHWHGLPVPATMDGVAQPELSQKPVKPGETFVYEFKAKPAGTFMYHSHVATDRQINVGLFGGFVIEPKSWPKGRPDLNLVMALNEWRVVEGVTYPAMPAMGEPNYFAVNGKTYPEIPALNVKQGQRVRIRFLGLGQFEHPMHLHGIPFKIVETDGYPVPEAAQLTKDVVSVHPGERYDIEFVADNPGKWAFHCRIVHHTTNDVEPGGLLFVVNVEA